MKPALVLCFFLVSFSCYSQVNLNAGLLAYYPFSGNANDASGNGNNGAPQNGVQLTTDRFGNANSAYHFDGVDDQIIVTQNGNLSPQNISVCVWVYAESSSAQSIVGQIDRTTGNHATYHIGINYDVQAGFFWGLAPPNSPCNQQILYDPNNPFVTSPTYFSPNNWHCVVGTFQDSIQSLYVDGVLVSTRQNNFRYLDQCSNTQLVIGKWWNGDPIPFHGKIDEVRIYNRALNIEEINALCSAQQVIINDYTPVQALDICTNKITVGNAGAFNVGDTVVMMQMKGAVIDSSNTPSFGNVTDYKNAGNYEFNYVKTKNGNVIELKNKLTRAYDIPNGKVQLIRVPYFTDYNLNATLTCLPWDGSKGGVVILNAQNQVTLNGNIDVTGDGFKGGGGYNEHTGALSCNQNDYSYPISNNRLAGQKGEGIADISTNLACGKGNAANGGGGGNGKNSGGAGGANGGQGGYGGYQLESCGGAPFDNRGIGGKITANSSAANKVFMGGGGGAGQADNPGNVPAGGGNGGGIVIILANKLLANSYRIFANGNNGTPCSLSFSADCRDGMGGGGAGGSVLLNINQYLDNVAVENKGGRGADMNGAVNAGARIGAGGGGGGGLLFIKNGSLPATISNINGGGANGVLLSDGNNPWGTTAGQSGNALYNLVIPNDLVAFKPNIDSVRIKDSLTSCTGFDFKGLAYTNTNPVSGWQWDFGDGGTASTQNTSHIYAGYGSYTVKLVVTDINGCKDSISKTVTLTRLDFDFNYSLDACNGLSVQFTGIGRDLQNPYWEFGDGGINSGTLNPVHIYASQGTYNIRYSVGNITCSDTLTKTINLSIIPDDIITTPDTTICLGATKQLRSKPSLNFCWSPATFLDNPSSPNPTTSTPHNITYYFTAQVTGTNLIVNGDFSAGNTGFTSQYSFANPNTTEGQFFVGANPQAWNGGLSNCHDHTSGSGNMLLVNGAPTPNINVWKETVAVTPNTNYAFSTWIQALFSQNPAQLVFSINTNDLGSPITASLPTCTWTQFYTTWNSGNNTSATISIVNKNTIVQGNDFALDDISFAPVFIKRDSVRITVDTPSVRTVNDLSGCRGFQAQLNTTGATTYSWSPATGLDNPNIANPVASPTITTQYIVTGINSFGCTATDTVNVTVFPNPTITKSNDTAICKNSSVQIFANGGTSYSWSPASTLSNASAPNPTATPPVATIYHVTVTDNNTCSSIDSVKVDIRPDPVFTVSGAGNVCRDDSVQLHAGGGDLYTWQPAGSLNNPSVSNPMASPQTATNYQVQITDTVCHNVGNLSTSIGVLELPTVKASRSADIDCTNDRSQLNATGASTYSWTPVGTLNNPSIQNPIATPTSPTRYTVKGTDGFGCINYDTVTVDVINVNAGGYLMPSAFSPNNDGKNDCFGVRYWGVIQKIDFSVYNRWGNLIFHTKTVGDCWDGTYHGVPQNPDVYVFLITAKTSCGEVFRKGTFVLVR